MAHSCDSAVAQRQIIEHVVCGFILLLFLLPGMAILSTLEGRSLVTPLEIKPLVLEHIFLLYLIIHWKPLRPNDLFSFGSRLRLAIVGAKI